MKYSIPKEIVVVFHNGLNYDYHEIVKEFVGEFNFLRENTEKYKAFSVPKTKEVKRIDKNRKDILKLQFINCARFMASLL